MQSSDLVFAIYVVKDLVIASAIRLGNFNAHKLVIWLTRPPRNTEIDGERGTLVNVLVPAQFFTVAEANQTYGLQWANWPVDGYPTDLLDQQCSAQLNG
nr:hypothetical protein [Mycobacterium leprae]